MSNKFEAFNGEVGRCTRLLFTVVTAQIPDRLTKIIGINSNGEMRKEAAAMLSLGKATRVEVSSLAELNICLDQLSSSQAITWGITEDPGAVLCTKHDHASLESGAISRTRDNFRFANGPGIMMLDHDGLPDGSLTSQQFRERLIEAVPALATAAMLWRPSASAGCRRADGQVLSTLTRHRIYIPVSNAALIPAAGRALETLLWASDGGGWVEVGNAGQLLPRCLVDTSVWQPERLDFAGPPILVDGVTREGIEGKVIGADNELFDLEGLIGLVNEATISRANRAQRNARARRTPEAEAKRQSWVQRKTLNLATSQVQASKLYANALHTAARDQVLMGNFQLTCSDGTLVSVAQILADPERWDGKRFADPLDPGEDRRVAVARLQNEKAPNIYTHRHGGMQFTLRSQLGRADALACHELAERQVLGVAAPAEPVPPGGAGFQWLDLRCAIEQEPAPLDFVLPGLKQGSVGAIVSPGGNGKSMFALQAAVTIAGGPDLLGLTDLDPAWQGTRGRVLFLTAEDPSDVLNHRVHSIGARLSQDEREAVYNNLQIAPLVGRGVDVMSHEWKQWIEAVTKGMRLVIIDTARRFHLLDENDGSDMAALLAYLEHLCRINCTTIIFLHHTSKAGASNGGDTQQASRGSSVLTDNARFQANMVGMSSGEAEKMGVQDRCRRSFVRIVFPKTNYSAPISDKWLRRHEGGVLEPTVLKEVVRLRREPVPPKQEQQQVREVAGFTFQKGGSNAW